MRLDKYIAGLTDYSRREVNYLIKQQAIYVNEAIALKSDQKIDEEHDEIAIHGNILPRLRARYFMLHKPQGTVCANQDSEHPTVMDLLDEPNIEQLQIVGRLDKETTGLVLITDDGQWNHKITSPRSQCSKTYKATLTEPLSQQAKKQLEEGIILRNEKKPTQPAIVKLLEDTSICLTIKEGKYHQVKRMLAAVGNHVNTLHRDQIGDIILDAELPLGHYRPLTQQEIESVL
jgi:16S rRNA pseudouridine516 synthase